MGENQESELGQVDLKAKSVIVDNGETLSTNRTVEKTLKRPLVTSTTDQSDQKSSNNLTGNQNPKKSRPNVIPMSIKSATVNKAKSKGSSFIYGNYDRYYGYRNSNDFKDNRLQTFNEHRNFFEGNNVLDIGCNNGLVTISIARDLNVKRIIGIDIDKRLVEKARRFLSNEKPKSDTDSESFPFNVEFKSGNYVLADEKLLELEVEQFNTILCLSVTKWIHLNCGDAGLKLAFRRMYKQLLPGGRLILEAQDWKSYKRRKNLTPSIANNYKSIQLFPQHFDEYLLSKEVGFHTVFTIDVPKHEAKGFQRPIKVFMKR